VGVAGPGRGETSRSHCRPFERPQGQDPSLEIDRVTTLKAATVVHAPGVQGGLETTQGRRRPRMDLIGRGQGAPPEGEKRKRSTAPVKAGGARSQKTGRARAAGTASLAPRRKAREKAELAPRFRW
jgi:hypothetical protein